jgi:hypothetical protein
MFGFFGAQSLAGNLPYKLGLRSMNMIDSKSIQHKKRADDRLQHYLSRSKSWTL